MKRVLTTLIGIPLVIALIKFTPDYVGIAAIFVAMLLALREYFRLTEGSCYSEPGYALAAGILFSFYFHDIQLALFFPLASGLILIVALFSRRNLEETFRASTLTLFGVCYVGGLMGYLVGIRRFDAGGETGADFLMLLFVIIWSNDVFAYLFGKSMGRHKLAPAVSPKKTVEGAIAGFLFGILSVLISRMWFVPQLTIRDAILLGALVGFMGQLGDLCESLVKRSMGVKDSGSLLPGHGGMLDRIDSLLFGAPTMYYYVYLVLN